MFDLNNRIDILRNWLNNNKIFFETIVAIFLAIMAITLTIVSINVSIKTNEIAYHETEIIKMENQPIFNFKVTYDYTYIDEFDYSVPVDEKLIINNVGKPLKEFSYEKMIFLKIRYWENGTYPKPAFIPIYYYFPGISTGNLINELVTFRGPYAYTNNTGNHLKILQAEKSLSEYVRRLDANNSASIYIFRYIKIEYTDIFENIHEEIYFVDPYNGAYKLNKNEGRTISKYYDSFDFEELTLVELSPSSLYEIWSMNENKSKELMSMGGIYY